LTLRAATANMWARGHWAADEWAAQEKGSGLMNLRAALLASAVTLLGVQAASAAPLVKVPFKDGSGNEAVIEPPIAHPDEAPCVVKLYHNAQFGASNVNFIYNPPANCPGPYSTIVLSVDVSLDAGIQYDRTGTIWIGGVPLWFGTTAEPNPSLGPSWHFERNVTDYTSLLGGTNPGFVLIANYTNAQDTSIITSSAKLLFYPVPNGGTAPTVPDEIIPLAADGGGTVGLNTGTDTVAIDQMLPTNIASANLDVFLQGQSNDEFWYTCVPNSLTGELESCGGGAFREGEITVDGTPAGVAPVYPWIFTGGIDPYLWAPIPGVQTLNFKPFRVPLTPFAGVLSNGAIAHQIALSVYGANGYFSVAGALLLYLDHGGSQVTGSVTQNTLAASPSPTVTNNLVTNNGVISGTLDTTSQRNFTITGSLVTSAGSETYTVNQVSNFANDQKFKISDTVYDQIIKQATNTTVQTSLVTSGGTANDITTLTYPLTVDYLETVQKSGDIAAKAKIAQDFEKNVVDDNGNTENTSTLQDSINTTDTLEFNSSGNFIGHHGQASTANYTTTSTTEPCFGRKLTAAKNVLTSVKTGCKQ
jgi:hypothetical protein